jgi:hypothetical protein
LTSNYSSSNAISHEIKHTKITNKHLKVEEKIKGHYDTSRFYHPKFNKNINKFIYFDKKYQFQVIPPSNQKIFGLLCEI